MQDVQENNTSGNNGGRAGRDYIWLLSCGLITVTAVFLRFFWLELKPLHHDEGVNGWFLTTLFNDGVYKYDPANYHGPTLYYISLAFANAFGLNTVSVRASVAIWGVLMVVLAFFLRPYLGKIGTLAAALFIALSPGMVFISRYYIHEIFFVFLSLAIVVSVVYFIDKRKAGIFSVAWTALILLVCFLPSTLKLATILGSDSTTALWSFRAGFFLVEVILIALVMRMLMTWHNGRPIYFLLAVASVALMFATKETAFITLGTMLIACFCIWIWRKLFKISDAPAGTDGDAAEPDIEDRGLTWANFRAAFGSTSDRLLLIAASAVVFVYISILFFSSFFTYFGGVKGAIDAYAIWTKTGSKDHTQNGTWAYFEWGMETEAPIFLLSALGGLLAFVKAKDRFGMFASLWAFGLFAAYTIIPYKTPWLEISFLLPMCLAAGYAVNELATAKNPSLKILAGLFIATAAGVLAYQSYKLNFVDYDEEDRALIYAHTDREFHDMVDKIEYYAEKSGRGTEMKVEIVSPDYWPLVWYLRNYKQANFHGRLVDTADAEMIVAKKNDQDTEVLRRYSARYMLVGKYHLRSGVDLLLLVRKDIADSDSKEVYRLSEP
jgi:uncharacterized protein (TIGR03663 family)